MSCLTIADLLADALDAAAEADGVDVDYYVAALTGYSTTTGAIASSEAAAVTVTGRFGEYRRSAPDGSLAIEATFTVGPNATTGVIPKPFDRFVTTRDGASKSYTVTKVLPMGAGATSAGFELFVEQA